MVKKFLTAIAIGVLPAWIAHAQLPDTSRLTNWYHAGLKYATPAIYQQVRFAGDTTGTVDNSVLLNQIFDTLSRPTLILFERGTYLFTQRIFVPGQTILKGLGNQQTHLIFNLAGRDEHALQFRGSESGSFFPVTEPITRGQQFIAVSPANAALFSPGQHIRLLQDDADLINDSWAANRTGQTCWIDSIRGGRIYISTPVRLSYALQKNPRIRRVNAIRFGGLECLKITRQDANISGSGPSNIAFNFASHCWVRGVESIRCNFAHVSVNNSTHLLIEENYFQDAHDFGSGGKGYGVMLHYATGDVLVQNNVFRRLRHAMIVQAGANGNVFAYNYALEGIKTFFGFTLPSEDLVCHGNYPYLNLFEGNYGEFAKIDDSHGKNGPNNTYFRNIATNGGFNITSAVSPDQNLIGNHSLSGSQTILSSGHHITDNSWQGVSGLWQASLAYVAKPAFLEGFSFPSIGPPAFNTLASIPARNRFLANQPVTTRCDVIIWDGTQWVHKLQPSLLTKAYALQILPGAAAIIETPAAVRKLDISAGASLLISQGNMLTVKE